MVVMIIGVRCDYSWTEMDSGIEMDLWGPRNQAIDYVE